MALGLLASCNGGGDGGADASLTSDAKVADSAPGDATGLVDSAPPDAVPPCTPEGAMRVVSCGNCGQQSESCTSGTWVPESACLNQGECAAGAVETEALPLCGEQQRLCNATCAWSSWSTTIPSDGACEPGEAYTDTASCPEFTSSVVTCDAACTWVPGPCLDGCGDTARTSPADSEERCIPAGTFRRYPSASGFYVDVSISAMYFDRYPVTNRRYRDCVMAGFCGMPTEVWAALAITDPARDQYPAAMLTWQQAVDFCTWDGGRRLVTEHEWMKAARGPSPRDNEWTWEYVGMDSFRCDLYPLDSCPGIVLSDPPGDPIDGLPGVRSVYGIDSLLGGGRQWLSDWAGNYDDTALTDPQGPAMSITGSKMQRGGFRTTDDPGSCMINFRQSGPPDNDIGTIRCGRTP